MRVQTMLLLGAIFEFHIPLMLRWMNKLEMGLFPIVMYFMKNELEFVRAQFP